jgi:uncharacterized LabA/DUF88 family protein
MKKNNKTKQITYAFIDSQNLNLGVRSQGWKLDFKRFSLYLSNKYNVKKAFLFIGYIPENRNLYDYLKKSGYVLIFKPVIESKRIKTKGNIDAELVLHTMIEFPNYDKAIIVSGDGDFYCLAQYLANKNKLLHILTPNKKYSSLLRKFARFIVYMDQLRGSLEIKKTGIRVRSKP